MSDGVEGKMSGTAFTLRSLVVQWLGYMTLTHETRVQFPAREYTSLFFSFRSSQSSLIITYRMLLHYCTQNLICPINGILLHANIFGCSLSNPKDTAWASYRRHHIYELLRALHTYNNYVFMIVTCFETRGYTSAG